MKKPADQAAEPENDKKAARLKIVMILLAALLALSAGGLVVRYIYLHFFVPTQATVTVPDNLIAEESAPPVSHQPVSDSPAGETGARTESA